MNLTVIRKNGTTYTLSDLGIKVRDFVVSSPEYIHETEKVEGADGVIDLGTTIGPRLLSASLVFTVDDLVDYPLVRNEIFRIFLSKESFYLIDEREPSKRWEVKCNSPFKPEQILKNGFFDVDFICAKGFAESIDVTLDMIIAHMTGNKEQKYKHTTSTFEILNDGDIEINPRKLPLVIQYAGASTNLIIKNLTTGDEWSYTGTSNAGDKIKLDGIRSTKNSLSIFRSTNRKLISLAPGWNEFELVGASGTFEITFDFRFYTL